MKPDANSFIEQCAPFEGMVYRHCLQLLRNSADAEDAAQETMLRAFRAMPRFLGQSSIGTWLYRIAHNTCLDFLKRPRVKRESASLDAMREQGYEPDDPAPTPEAAYLSASDQAQLRAAMEKLPEDQRVLLSLRYGDGMSYEQLAQALGLNEGTVKSRLSRAKDRLRALLEESS